jgi:hypothetical protein
MLIQKVFHCRRATAAATTPNELSAGERSTIIGHADAFRLNGECYTPRAPVLKCIPRQFDD